MELRAVFFDMGGTIETFGYTHDLRLKATAGIQQMLKDAGIDLGLSDEVFLDMISNGLQRYHDFRLKSLIEIPPQQVWCEYILPGYSFDTGRMNEIAEDLMFYIETHYYQREMRPEIPAVLMAIQQSGLKIGMISNVISRGQVPFNLGLYGIKQYFSPIVLSCEYGRRKPDPAIFHHAARLAGLPASACLYIGDRVSRDIVGAKEAGFKMAIQISHDFDHGEVDDGAVPDAVISSMSELLDILRLEKSEYDSADISSSPGPRAVLFDAGDILYHRPRKGVKLEKFLSEQGLRLSDLDAGCRSVYEQQAYEGQITPDEYREGTIRCYGITDPEKVKRGRQIILEEDNDIEFFEGVPETLKTLKKDGHLLGIITDTAMPVSDKLRWFKAGGFGNVWDSIISSAEIGVRKPHPAIYNSALNQLGISASEAVFVGHKASELEGAHNAGMKTVAFNYEQDARADCYIEHFSDLLTIPVLSLTALSHPTFQLRNNPGQNDPAKEESPAVRSVKPGTGFHYNVSLSTMWGVVNCNSVEEMFHAADEMGFIWVELNHMIDSSMLNGMDLSAFPISSIHEPCPADISTVELRKRDWLVSSLDEKHRQKGVDTIRRSIDLAHRLNVRTIVMHCGQISSTMDYEKPLRKLFAQKMMVSDEYQKYKNLLLQERSRKIDAHFAAVKRSLAELLEYADKLNVRIGLENRFHYLDIPNQDEMQELLEMADETRLGFIYDAGHAQALGSMGFLSNEMWLKRFAHRIFGTHLHDVRGLDDHFPPGMGDVDFNMVAGYLPKDAFRTCEIHGTHTMQQLQNGLKVLEAAGCIDKLL